MPVAPVSPAYSLQSGDFGKLHYIAELLQPAIVFAQDGAVYGGAIENLGIDPELIVFESGHEVRTADFNRGCHGLTLLAPPLAAARATSENPEDHVILPDVIALEPSGIIVPEGEVRDGGSYEDRFRNIAVWNSLMDENDYLVKRWTEFLSA